MTKLSKFAHTYTLTKLCTFLSDKLLRSIRLLESLNVHNTMT